MMASQADRARIAARTDFTPKPANMAAFPPEPTKPAPAPVRNRRAPRMTAVQRNSVGRRSEWSRSPYAPAWGWR